MEEQSWSRCKTESRTFENMQKCKEKINMCKGSKMEKRENAREKMQQTKKK
jgi:hypothetical protein